MVINFGTMILKSVFYSYSSIRDYAENYCSTSNSNWLALH